MWARVTHGRLVGSTVDDPDWHLASGAGGRLGTGHSPWGLTPQVGRVGTGWPGGPPRVARPRWEGGLCKCGFRDSVTRCESKGQAQQERTGPPPAQEGTLGFPPSDIHVRVSASPAPAFPPGAWRLILSLVGYTIRFVSPCFSGAAGAFIQLLAVAGFPRFSLIHGKWALA